MVSEQACPWFADLHSVFIQVEQLINKYNSIISEIQREYVWGNNDFNILDKFFNDIKKAIGWLDRTGNGMPHTTTRKTPSQEWIIEKEYLTPWASIHLLPLYIMRYVRLANTISYQGNFYTVPQGTFKKDVQVMIWIKEDELHIHDDQTKFLCKHLMPANKGNKVINTDHKRDKIQKLRDLVADIAALF